MERQEGHDEFNPEIASTVHGESEESRLDDEAAPEEAESSELTGDPGAPVAATPAVSDETVTSTSTAEPASEVSETMVRSAEDVEDSTSSNDPAATREQSNLVRIEPPPHSPVALPRPPSAPLDRHARLLPLERDVPLDDESDASESSSEGELFPFAELNPSQRVPKSASPEPLDDGGDSHPVPRIQVMVSLADARAMYADAITEALDRKAAQFKQVARS